MNEARYIDSDDYLAQIAERSRQHMEHADQFGYKNLASSAADVHHLLQVIAQLKEDLRLLTAEPVTPGKVADLPCPACGNERTNKQYCDGCKLRPSTGLRATEVNSCHDGDLEHFHRYCDCGYGWRTDDVIDARVRCEYELRRCGRGRTAKATT